MKKQLIQLWLLLVFITVCSCSTKKTLTPPEKTLTPPAILTGNLPIDSASILISDLLQKPTLNKLPVSYALGGTFPAKLFRLQPGSTGIILWFCFKGGTKPELFLALEQLQSYDTNNLPHPLSSKLDRSEFLFKDGNGTHNSSSEIKTFITNHAIANNSSIQIDNALVVRYVNSFDSLLNKMPDLSGQKYSKYPFSYFEENSKKELKRFVDQAGADGFVRYYFGFDEMDKPNRIRVVLVAVTAGGKNITKINGKDALILQKSFPPPPYN